MDWRAAAVIMVVLPALLGGAGCDRGGAVAAVASPPWSSAVMAARLGVAPSTLRCQGAACRLGFPDGGALEVAIAAGGTGLRARVEGLVLTTAPLERYLADTLADLGRPGPARCGAAVRVAVVGARIACELPGGGRAWAVVGEDATFTVELALEPAAVEARDPAAAAGRDEALEDDLVRQSRALAVTVDEQGEPREADPDDAPEDVPEDAAGRDDRGDARPTRGRRDARGRRR